MNMMDVARDARRSRVAQAAMDGAKAAAALPVVVKARKTAHDLADKAQERAQEELSRRRDIAADTLESLVDALRPSNGVAAKRNRRRVAAIAGGSGLLLTAAVGIGVAVGYALSRRKAKTAEATADGDVQPSLPGVGFEDDDYVTPAERRARSGAGLSSGLDS